MFTIKTLLPRILPLYKWTSDRRARHIQQRLLPPSHLLNISTEKRVSATDMACHLRSMSLPSRPRSNVEEELYSLEASISSPSITIKTISDGLIRLGDIYGIIEEIMCLPSNQVCSSEQKKMLDREMECSLELLDLCAA